MGKFKANVKDKAGNDIIIESDDYNEYMMLLNKVANTLQEDEKYDATRLLLEQL